MFLKKRKWMDGWLEMTGDNESRWIKTEKLVNFINFLWVEGDWSVFGLIALRIRRGNVDNNKINKNQSVGYTTQRLCKTGFKNIYANVVSWIGVGDDELSIFIAAPLALVHKWW